MITQMYAGCVVAAVVAGTHSFVLDRGKHRGRARHTGVEPTVQCPAARRPSHPSHVALRACPASLSLSSFCCACSLGCSCPSTSLFSTRRRYQAPGGVYSTSQPGAQVSGWPHIPPPTYLPQVLVGTRGLCASTRLVLYAPGFGSAASLSFLARHLHPANSLRQGVVSVALC